MAEHKTVNIDGREIRAAYVFKPEKLAAAIAASEEAGRFVSFYRVGGSYWGIVEALSLLGENKCHPFHEVFDKYQEIMNCDSTRDKQNRSGWDKFVGKKARSEETGKMPLDKFAENIEVLQRMGGSTPYGFKLAQTGACINVFLDDDKSKMIELKTGIDKSPHEIEPINESRRARKPVG